MSVNVKVKMNLKFPELKLQEQLFEIMNKVIRPDINKRMHSGVNLNNEPHRPNSPKTIEYKLNRGLRTTVPLIASGQLVSSFMINLVDDNKVVMYPEGMRTAYPIAKTKKRRKPGKRAGLKPQKEMDNNELADILQNQGLKNGYKYEFFGISEEAERESMKLMTKLINRQIKKNAK